MAAAIVALFFMILFCAGLGMHFATDPATLDPDQRALFEAEPAWVLAASVVAGLAGLAGAFLLVARRRLAENALLLSTVAALLWLAGIITGPMRDLLSVNDLAVLIVVCAIFWTIYWFARHSRQRGWLR